MQKFCHIPPCVRHFLEASTHFQARILAIDAGEPNPICHHGEPGFVP
jgi:hypothetical protein